MSYENTNSVPGLNAGLLHFLSQTKVKKPVLRMSQKVQREFLQDLCKKSGRVITAFYTKDKQGADFGTMLFPFRSDCSCKKTHIFDFDSGKELFSTESDILTQACLGKFDYKGALSYARFKSLRFSCPSIYLPEESAGAFLEHYLREQGYMDILALPIIATQLRILEQARKNLYKKYQNQKATSLDPATADKDAIRAEYLNILYRSAADKRKILAVSQNEARWLHFSLAKLKASGLTDILTEPYENSVKDILLNDPNTAKKELKKMIEAGVLTSGQNLLGNKKAESRVVRDSRMAQPDLFESFT